MARGLLSMAALRIVSMKRREGVVRCYVDMTSSILTAKAGKSLGARNKLRYRAEDAKLIGTRRVPGR